MVRAELGLFSKSKPDVIESLISGTSQKLPFLCYYHIFSSYIFKWIIFHWCWVGFVYCQKIHQLLYRTGGLQERVTEYLGLFRFVLHSEYYSTELEFFFFWSTVPASGKVSSIKYFRSACPFSSPFFLPLCQICFDKWSWQN